MGRWEVSNNIEVRKVRILVGKFTGLKSTYKDNPAPAWWVSRERI
jgi:hypothetical protein